jgi:N-methylhydantoinase A
MKHNIRIAIDTGGTFTDIVLFNEDTGEFLLDKVLSTPENVLVGIMNSIDKIDNKINYNLAQQMQLMTLGFTTALNAILEQKGAKTAYLTSLGFRDVPEIGRYNRAEPFNMKYKKPAQLVPKSDRYEVPERIDYRGEIRVPLDRDAVRDVAAKIKKKQFEAIAICFLHSFRNPIHEREAREILQKELPEIDISISSDIVREHREYERSMTTILDAYIKPILFETLNKLDERLSQKGFKGQVVLNRSDGGGMTIARTKESSIHTLLSGPSGGVMGGLPLSKRLSIKNIITADLGGTSFDISMIKDGHVRTAAEMNVSGYPVLIPNIDIHTIGSGGGSIAWVDVAGALHVGPMSAGANPGPVCYDNGGTEPTITDALLCSEYINPNNFLGGEKHLVSDKAQKSIEKIICQPLNLDFESGCRGILRVSLSNMVEGIKRILFKEGDDARDFNLLIYGGAGPLFGNALIEQLEMASVVIPIGPANFSAWGMLHADLRYDFSMTQLFDRTDTTDFESINAKINELVATGVEVLKHEGINENKQKSFFALDLRYPGQEHSVTLPVRYSLKKENLNRLYEDFTNAYQKTYGYKMDQPAEIATLRVTCIGEISKPTFNQSNATHGTDADQKTPVTRSVYCFLNDRKIEHEVYNRSYLEEGNVIEGPALIEEATSVTTVLPGYACTVDKSGVLIINRR